MSNSAEIAIFSDSITFFVHNSTFIIPMSLITPKENLQTLMEAAAPTLQKRPNPRSLSLSYVVRNVDSFYESGHGIYFVWS